MTDGDGWGDDAEPPPSPWVVHPTPRAYRTLAHGEVYGGLLRMPRFDEEDDGPIWEIDKMTEFEKLVLATLERCAKALERMIVTPPEETPAKPPTTFPDTKGAGEIAKDFAKEIEASLEEQEAAKFVLGAELYAKLYALPLDATDESVARAVSSIAKRFLGGDGPFREAATRAGIKAGHLPTGGQLRQFVAKELAAKKDQKPVEEASPWGA